MSETTTGWSRAAWVAGACALLLGLGACSSGGEGQGEAAPSSPATASASPEGTGASSGGTSAAASPSATVSDAPASPSATQASPEADPTSEPPETARPTETAEPTAAPTVPTAPPPAPSASDSDSGAGETPDAAASCSTNDLRIAVDTEEGAAGSTYYSITMTNGGDAACAISGYPGVSFVGADGSTVGASAAPASDLTGAGQTLEPGDATEAVLRSTQADLYGETCQKENASGLQVTAPGDDSSLTVNFPLSACGNPGVQQLSVSEVGAGSAE
ncbi:DUF4232 domain-containing protein [Rothia halotolerans]|uniref:DUF4232 domain-containing protein n=1 Tax=Rothia halotolerans TaxID=405770 RepID=UPI00101D2F3E|nr:DUF4232 domain-containing protein [Rothia halotolerans]